ncbi:glycosyltransferase family 39 protein [Luteimonas sp. MC1895]|uniref:ArnT family glycosyltransferase n=1 Tax=Luteimonas sp. MC1895 TaxID=2819513 RepID=UPI0018F0A13B|nr:glycosyltransferase family 39 protein [Luteimonas sp. MC1895]MBJ6978453.1 glycosyltransferase family 39 protein [Luteimonas sp. MC1895]
MPIAPAVPSPSPPSSRFRRLLLPALLVLLALAAGIGLREPSPPDEPRFVLAAKTMVEGGDWLVPRRGREFYAEKPPVFMWMQAASWTLLRDWRVAFLLPSLLAALATLWLVQDAAWRLWGTRHAPWAAGALFACLQFGLQAKRAQIDMVLVALTTLSLWALLRYLLESRERRWLALGMFAAGLGTVTKGVGFLPVLVLLPWLWARRQRPGPSGGHAAAEAALALAAFIAGSAVWLAPLGIALLRQSDPALQAYARELLFRQTGTRYVNAWHHVQPAWYYAQTIMTLWLPGALLLPWLLPAWWRRLRRGDPRHMLLLGWVALVLLFFSLSPGKREVYVFPALPAGCLAAAPLLPALFRRAGVQWLMTGWLLLCGAVLLGAAASGLSAAAWATHLGERRGIAAADMRTLLWALGALGTAAWGLAAALRGRRVAFALVVFVALLWTSYGLALAPALDDSSSGRALMREVSAEIGAQGELGAIAWREQHMLQAGRPMHEFGFRRPWHLQWRDAAAWVAQAPDRRWLWLPERALGPCVDRGQARMLGHASREDWWLVPGTAIQPRCSVPAFARDDG